MPTPTHHVSHEHPRVRRSVAILFMALLTGSVGCNLMSIATKPAAQNIAPEVVAAASPDSGLVPLTVQFSGVASDSDGSIASYRWNFGDGGGSNQLASDHIYRVAGTYTATLVATDDRGATASSAVIIHVTIEGNQPPSASILASPASGVAPLAVSFMGDGADVDGSVVGYAWAFGDGVGSSVQNPSHSYAAAGIYTARLTVTDNQGATGTATVRITATGSTNLAPLANAGADQLNKDPGLTMLLSGAGSSDPDGSITGYAWTQVAGPAVTLTGASTASPSFRSATTTTASYSFRLTVTDNGSPARTASDTVVVSTRVTYDNAVGALLLARGTQSNGQLLGCTSSGCHSASGGLSPLTTYAEVFSVRSGVKSKISPGGSMLKFLIASEAPIIISWVNAGAPQKN